MGDTALARFSINLDPVAMRSHFDAEFERAWRLEAERARAEQEQRRARFWRRLGFGQRGSGNAPT